MRAARLLASECFRASSLAHHDVLPAYLPVTSSPVAAELAARLEAKRMTLKRMLSSLEQGLAMTNTLDGNPSSTTLPGSGETPLLLKKLDAGGFSAVSRNSAEDLRDKADYLGILWIQKHGNADGLKRYSHIRSLVLSDAARAYEATKNENPPFGLKMLSELRARFKQRKAAGDILYDCGEEHLEGFAYSLTSECKVQWSIDRPWEST